MSGRRTIEVIDPDQEARREAVQKAMFADLNRVLLGQNMTQQTVETAREIVAHHSRLAKRNGVDWPELAIMVFPLQGGIEVVRRDMDVAGIRQTILNLTVKYPRITAQEIADAVMQLWPDVRTLDFVRHKPGVG